ncbi:family 10 glycosylhydrolase [Carboxylicivirga sp. A043]|uniref:family 10 glycosylhydrolase n=1 Tax=Carboxylicivirga litoralis TaxID=2816963 RepID=UPI0021CB2532|nr:family 10 glycosylhydrolase [Carboxylicivirga sp. A043]MCU4155336.1 family 10 glycosylhydrolase [Carboxylicivirga sp. A043]
MKLINKLIGLIVLFTIISLSACQPAKEESSAKHFVWMGEGKNEGTEELEKMFIKLKETGIDGVMYQTSLEKYAAAVELAHKHGLELHAWQTILRRYDDKLLSEHADWYTVSRDGRSTAEHQPFVDYYKWLCPTKPVVRAYLTKVVEDLAEVPNIDGVHLDYIRHSDVILARDLWDVYGLVMDKEYAEFDFCYCDDCIERYKKETGEDASTFGDAAPDNDKWRQFRYDMVTETVAELTKAVHAKGNKINAAVFPTPTISKKLVRQEWDKWALDAYYPMNYQSFYREGIDWIEQSCVEGVAALNGRAPLYSGLYMPAFETPEDFRMGIQASKKGGAAGVCIFTPYELTDEHWAILKEEIDKW